MATAWTSPVPRGARSSGTASWRPVPMTGETALVVGADPWRLAEYAAELESNGVEAHVTRRTDDLRERLTAFHPTFIIFDQVRPLVHLLQLYLVTRNLDGYFEVPILLVGADLDDHVRDLHLPAETDPAEAVITVMRAGRPGAATVHPGQPPALVSLLRAVPAPAERESRSEARSAEVIAPVVAPISIPAPLAARPDEGRVNRSHRSLLPPPQSPRACRVWPGSSAWLSRSTASPGCSRRWTQSPARSSSCRFSSRPRGCSRST